MTRILVAVSSPEEAEAAVGGGADFVEAQAAAGGAPGGAEIRAIVAAVRGRRPTSAWLGAIRTPEEAGAAASTVAGTGADFARVAFPPTGTQREAIQAMADMARPAELVGGVFADLEPDLMTVTPLMRKAGFAAVVVAVARPEDRLLLHAQSALLARFVEAARAAGMLAGFGGALEPPDLPRLAALAPDFIALRRADAALLPALRRAISGSQSPPDATAPGQNRTSMRVFVRDLVLPVHIGAYSHERGRTQRVRFDVTVDLDPPGAGEAAQMGDVFSYDVITDGIAAIVAAGHVDLVETLALRVVDRVFAERGPRRVTVRVEKVDLGPGGVGVEITADRPADLK